jgi:colanic acid/amylovoran biosynthesis glycosyltransferase
MRPVGRSTETAPRLAYIVSRYPWISHAFILREVLTLRLRGLQIETYTVRATPEDQLLSAADRDEQARTEPILPLRPARQLRSHVSALLRTRRRYLTTLAEAVRTGPAGARARLWQVFYFGEAVQLWDRTRQRGIRHVHAHFANNGADIAMLAAKLGAPGPVSWSFSMHATGLDDVSKVNLSRKVRSAAFIVCISDYTRSQLMLLGDANAWPKLRVVRLGVDIERFRPRETPRRAAPLRMLFVGRMTDAKNPSGLVDAAIQLIDEGHDFQLTVAGNGVLREPLKARVAACGLEDVITLPGPVSQDDIVELYQDHDVFCLPSLVEGLPVVLMEAMACSLPVVSTHIMGIPELVEPGLNGLLVAPGNVAELTDALRTLLQMTPSEREALGRAARASVVTRYELGRNVDELARVFETELDKAIVSSHQPA